MMPFKSPWGALSVAFVCLSCAPTSSAVSLKSPVSNQCAQAQLRGCEAISDGVLLYVEGRQSEALPKLSAGAADNPPERVQKFAELLSTWDESQGTTKYSASLRGVVAALSFEAAKNQTRAKSRQESERAARSRDKGRATQRTVTADTDPHQLRDGLEVSPTEPLGWCAQTFGAGSTCATIAQGPLYLTDAAPVGKECRGQFLAVMAGGELLASFEEPVRMHGARIFIPGGNTLVFGQRSAPPPAAEEGEPEAASTETETREKVVLNEAAPEWSCLLYWSGFVPYGAEVRGREGWTKESGF